QLLALRQARRTAGAQTAGAGKEVAEPKAGVPSVTAAGEAATVAAIDDVRDLDQQIEILRDEVAALAARTRCSQPEPVSAPRENVGPAADGGERAGGAMSRLSELYGAMFGRLPYTTPWHPYDTVLRHVRRAVTEAAAA